MKGNALKLTHGNGTLRYLNTSKIFFLPCREVGKKGRQWRYWRATNGEMREKRPKPNLSKDPSYTMWCQSPLHCLCFCQVHRSIHCLWKFEPLLMTVKLQLCTGCVYHKVFTSRWLSWRFGWSRTTIPESAGSCRRPAQSSPTSVSIVTPTARDIISANNCRSTDISSRYSTRLELIAIRHPSIFFYVCLPSMSETFLFRQSFPDIVL